MIVPSLKDRTWLIECQSIFSNFALLFFKEVIMSEKKKQGMNLPNRLSIARIITVPLIVLVMLFPYAQFDIALPVFHVYHVGIDLKSIVVLALFIFGSITDWMDGYIARHYNLITTFGKFIDPLADKMLTTTMFILFATTGTIPVVPVLIMIWRDLLVDGIRMMASNAGIVMAAGILGKLKTVIQMLAIVVIAANNLPFELWGWPVHIFLLWLAMFVSVMSGVSYFVQAKDILLASK
jgi:CDP-diacylglycerol---glycerol-3-phosphate 3-phosphatidyltransferase